MAQNLSQNKNSDTEKWANATDEEMQEIAKAWAHKYSIRTLRVFQLSYIKNRKGSTDVQIKAMDNRWQVATWAIDYRAFELNKKN
jgi:hypothetical protein